MLENVSATWLVTGAQASGKSTLHRQGGRHDQDAFVAFQLQQMRIPGDHQIGLAATAHASTASSSGSSIIVGEMIAGTTTMITAA
jgi:hypothetical protein